MSSSPQLAVSAHAWDGYFINPGRAEMPAPALLAHLDALAAMNRDAPNTVSRVRFDIGWSASQPTPAPPGLDNYYNRRFLNLFADLAKRGLTPYLVVHQAPVWARPASAGAKYLPTDPQDIAPWARWLAATFAPWVSEIEVWNEPNLEAFTGTGMNTPERYMALLDAFADAAREGNPRVKIIGGNVSQCDWLWMARAYDLGLGDVADIIGVHPYQGRQSLSPRSVDVTGINRERVGWEKARISWGLPRLYQVMIEHGDRDKPIWNTEAGWSASSTGVGLPGLSGEQIAAKFHREWLDMCVTGTDAGGLQEAYRRVRLSTVYQLHDPSSTADAHQRGFDIVFPDGTLRPQARALMNWRRANPTLRALY